MQTQADATDVSLKLPLLDSPFNTEFGYRFPSMQQSLSFSKGFYDYSHSQIARAYEQQPTKSLLATAAFDVLSLWLPLGSGWLHEEWHRAVMSRYDIHSYDEIYDFNLFSELVSVSHVSDEDLIHLKQLYPASLIRLHAAGMEAQNELNRVIEQDVFFQGRAFSPDLLLWFNNLNNTDYLYTCATNDSNRITHDLLNSEGSNIAKRDFTGLDCDAWVYDLFRPNEPYAARGTHPSGVGVKRYIAYEDLSDTEKNYLHKQIGLSLLNLINPMLYYRDHFTGKNPLNGHALVWNAALRHYLTSFGYTVDINILIQQEQQKLTFTLHNYFNHHHYFPGISLVLLDKEVSLWGKPYHVTPHLDVWLQPMEQQFETSHSKLGARLAFELTHPISTSIDDYIAIDAKTDGWVAGNVYLGDNVSLRLGLVVHLR